jgi:hypothetical protein
MEASKGNKGLLDKKRFEQFERDKNRWLRTLSWEKAIQLEEDMLSCALLRDWRNNFTEDHPVCLKLSLKSNRKR